MEDWKAELAESFWEIERSNKVLRTMKDRDGDLWFEIAATGLYVQEETRSEAGRRHRGDGMSLADLKRFYGPLTDVTDTSTPGEPLDAAKSGDPVLDEYGEPLAQWERELLAEDDESMSYEEAEYWGRMDPRKPEPGDAGTLINQCESISPVNTYRCDHTKNHRGAHEHQGVEWHGAYPTEHAPKITCVGASVGEPIKPLTYGKDYQIGDTDVLYRKPEPGDRVPQIGDTVAVALDEENGSTVVGILSATYDDKFWIEGDDFDLQVPHQGSQITVIEPARPAVPEEPEPCVLTDENKTMFLFGEDHGDEILWRDESGTARTWLVVWECFGPLYKVERGTVIG